MSTSFFNSWNEFLNKYHLYYRNLGDAGRQRFVSRVESVVNNTQIRGKQGLDVDGQVRVLVAANLVQLTFGLKQYWLYGYEFINLYPDAFPVEGEKVKGSTYNDRIISLSWRDFAMDHLTARNGQNVSFSQFALALVRTVLNGKKFDLAFGSYLEPWFEIIKKETAQKAGVGAPEAAAKEPEDIAYVFAKCTELFFETPEIFKRDLPTSYAHLCLLLNQDPLNIVDDYKYNRPHLNRNNLRVQLPTHITYNYKYKTWHWSYNLPFFGFALCPMVLYFQLENVLVTLYELAFVSVSLAFIASLVFFGWLKRIGLFNRAWLLLANCLVGLGPCVVTAYIVLNNLYTWPSSSSITRHKIASYYKTKSGISRTGAATTFNFSDDFLVAHPKARTFEGFNRPVLPVATLFNGVEYEIRTGLLGLPILINRNLY